MARTPKSATSRARKKGDDSTNARKRYYRASERYLKKAEETTGATSNKYKQLAKQNFEDALNTYEPGNKQRYSKPIQKLAETFGYDLEGHREKRTQNEKRYKKVQREAIDKSTRALESALEDPEARRQAEARALLNNDAIGSRILGGLVDVWKDEASVYDDEGNYEGIDNEEILPALFDYFEVDNLADMLEMVEEIIGDKLYADEDSDTMYEAVKILIQTKIVENESIE